MGWGGSGPFGGQGTLQVNSQLVPVPMTGQFYPSLAAAPFYKGSGQISPTLPLNMMSAGGTDSSVAAATANPWSFTDSPLPIAVGALIVGMLGLRYIHWRG